MKILALGIKIRSIKCINDDDFIHNAERKYQTTIVGYQFFFVSDALVSLQQWTPCARKRTRKHIKCTKKEKNREKPFINDKEWNDTQLTAGVITMNILRSKLPSCATVNIRKTQ